MKDVKDTDLPQPKVFKDDDAGKETTYFYRVVAKNSCCESEPSNVMPILSGGIFYANIDEECWTGKLVDEFSNITLHHMASGDIRYNMPVLDDRSAAVFYSDASMLYELEKDATFFSLQLCWSKDSYNALSVLISEDGKRFTKLNALTRIEYGTQDEFTMGRLEARLNGQKVRYIRIQVKYEDYLYSSLFLCRLEIDYEH